MSDPVCPSCGALLLKMPQRKTKCKACGEFMFIKGTPDNRAKRLMTAAQADAAEAMWIGHNRQTIEASERANFGVSADNYDGEPGPADSSLALDRARQLARAGQHGKMAVMGLYMSSKNSTEALGTLWALLLIEVEGFRDLAHTMQLHTTGGRPCSRCKALDRKVVSIDAPVDELLPEDCPRLMEPVGRKRALCNVTASVWIKRPDGTDYLDRKPSRARPPMSPTELEQARKAWSSTLGIDLPKASEPAVAQGLPPEPLTANRPRSWWRRLLGLE